MTTKTLTVATISADFPAGTVEEDYSWKVTGILADGITPYSYQNSTKDPVFSCDLPDGTFSVSVGKNGHFSLPSDAFSILTAPPVPVNPPPAPTPVPVTTVQFVVPDSGAKVAVA